MNSYILASVIQNPFDIVPNEALLPEQKTVLWGLILLSSLAFTLLFTFFRHLMMRILQSIISINLYKQLCKDIYAKGVLDFIFPCVVAIYTLTIFGKILFPIWTVFQIFLSLCLAIFIKIGLVRVIGILFDFKKAAHFYSSTIIIFYITLGIILIPFNLFLTYPNGTFQYLLLKIGIALTFIMFFARYLRASQVNYQLIAHNKFHFLLYICTLEIGPFLVIYRLIINQLIL